MSLKFPRRSFLTTVGATFLVSGTASASKRTEINPVTLKGDLEEPVQPKHVKEERRRLVQQYNLDDGTNFPLYSFENDSTKIVVGYGFSIDNGVPVETVYKIPNIEGNSSTGANRTQSRLETQKSPPENDQVDETIENFHSEIDQFEQGSRNSIINDDQVSTNQVGNPEPGWDKQGELNVATAVHRTYYDGSSRQIGRIDLDSEVWKSMDENRDSEDKYACALRGEMWPSKTIDHIGEPYYRNDYSHLIQDWDATMMGSPTITESDPDNDESESIDMTLSITTSKSAGLTVDWQTPYISRSETSQPDETVGWEFTYPWRAGSDARHDHIQLYCLGESWLDSSHREYDMILDTKFEGRFKKDNPEAEGDDTLHSPVRWNKL
ncbi:hypothetical protein [Haloarcula salina]|uniref:Uncharacterized protein n=1 Tax=Haloarcula salina TaxID=1429914 RepID=A0AA41G3A1_9EURY|nr:hypothetical protein [Haloarcula salina]MBV0903501.1 hypothetical protein [Haloarcula salina]